MDRYGRAYGNSSTCEQTISLVRPTLADVVCPPNYDDLQAPAFRCDVLLGYPTPEAIEAPAYRASRTSGQVAGCNINYGYTGPDHPGLRRHLQDRPYLADHRLVYRSNRRVHPDHQSAGRDWTGLRLPGRPDG